MKDKKQIEIVKEVLDWAKYIAAAFLFALIINNTLIINAEVGSPSMESTIMTGSKIFGLRHAYIAQDPQRYDIIVFKFPDDESSDPFVKRIIALPNEKVDIIDGKVYINDSTTPLDDSFTNEAAYGNYGSFIVPEDCYFVLGDNRNNSNDSKDWANKYVSKDKILGKVYFNWFPNIKILN